ncbi:hypothetical protein HF324_17050 [Chitinophaga oryzae]|uniref:WG repeat-containing protein n=1 Tax=Chitinophaga oryzae TaxID=2725414 RepID=A0ABX6LHH1_9BACT|nr:hypothetical protein [Chitinophaga oryzae]QJB39471.1 hypothetical protein HF324_17050 [Chitinophaga oryzae]
MKKRVGIFLTFVLLMSFSTLIAQDLKALVTPEGKVCFKLNVEGVNLYVNLNGKLMEFNANVHYNVLGNIDKIGDVSITCDVNGFIIKIGTADLKYGIYKRIEKIGSTQFGYGANGRINRINDKMVNYDLLTGKIDKIANALIYYNEKGEVDRIVDNDGIISFIPNWRDNVEEGMKPYWIKNSN